MKVRMHGRSLFYPAALVVSLLAAGAATGQGSANPEIPFPDFDRWTHVKSMVIFDKKHPLYDSFGGVHHVYANDKALPSTREKKPYADGSALAFVLYEAREADGAYVQGPRKLTAVVVKDSRRFGSTGGWGFQAWGADKKPLVTDGGESCFACHRSGASETDFIFSRFER